MDFDESRGELVVFGGINNGGFLGDTWTWDATEWTQRTSPTSPSARKNPVVAYDAARGRIVLFGGFGNSGLLQDTWEWDGNQWTEHTPTNLPEARSQHMLAYDAAGRRVVLLGGRGGSSNAVIEDMWAWDGTEWSELNPTHMPNLETVRAMSYDTTRQRLICIATDQVVHTVWEFKDGDWVQRATNAPPTGRTLYAMTYVVSRSELLLDGGRNAFGAVADSWILDASADLRSAAIFSADWSQTLARVADIERVTGFGVVGGRGYTTTATAIAGSEVLAWDAYAGKWTLQGSNSAGPSNPSSLSFTTATRPDAQRLIDNDGKIHLRFQPAAGIGVADDLGGLSLDYVEVTVHYTIGATDTATCGDSRIDLISVDSSRFPEVCDDGNTANTDGCSAACTRETGYSCSGEPSICVECGDTFIEGLETCDDGNFINGDGCNEVCQIEYGYTCTSATPSVCTQ